jgi:p-aminobenzoyl-glutamate transporter AbgT
MLCFLVKLYPRVLGLAATPDPRVIFIILIIILNLHDSSLSEFDCNIRPNSLGCGSDCKVVS